MPDDKITIEAGPEYVVSGAMTYCKGSKPWLPYPKLFEFMGPGAGYKQISFYAPESRKFQVGEGIPAVDSDTTLGVNIGDENETEFYGECLETGEKCKPSFQSSPAGNCVPSLRLRANLAQSRKHTKTK